MVPENGALIISFSAKKIMHDTHDNKGVTIRFAKLILTLCIALAFAGTYGYAKCGADSNQSAKCQSGKTAPADQNSTKAKPKEEKGAGKCGAGKCGG